jgi:hypothetical protein
MADGGSGAEVEATDPVDFLALYPGAVADVRLDHMADYGAIMDIVGQEDLVGLVHPHQGAQDEALLGGRSLVRFPPAALLHTNACLPGSIPAASLG